MLNYWILTCTSVTVVQRRELKYIYLDLIEMLLIESTGDGTVKSMEMDGAA